ncbi:MAG: aminomethyl-transferring glycine dehydrogenase subunit GcvPA [Myxococcaceae bacterium]
MRYLSHTPDDIVDMLQIIGQSSIENLFDSIPKENRLNRPLELPKALSEIELKTLLNERAGHAPKLSFLGAGACTHHVPELVSQMLLRGEWLTAYTPYQPEVSQGTLQAIFEFQTIVAGLFGLEIANASMYDGATALAEACLMACRLKPGTPCVFIPKTVHPEYREVCETILGAARIKITDQPGNSVAAVVYQNPNFFGQLEPQAHIIQEAHQQNALAIAVCTDPVALGAIASPGSLGADIAVGEGIGLCGHLSLGAPGVGLFATKKEFLRQMPGRLCGQTVDSKGQRGFVLTLSTREQHIRREKATSNICTNHNLMALAFTMTLSLYGKTGFRELAYQNIKKAIYLRQKAQKAGLQILFNGPHFNETVLKLTDTQAVRKLEQEDIFAGVFLDRWYPEYKNCLLVATTELYTEEGIDNLVRSLT